MRIYLTLTLGFFLYSLFVFAEPSGMQENITGKVLNEQGAGIPGISITNRQNKASTSSDANGSFVMPGKLGDVLVLSSIGYEGQEITLLSKEVTITLKTSDESIDEVVVVGYGTMKKRDVTGSIASVSGEKMSEYVVPNPIQGLQGRVAGGSDKIKALISGSIMNRDGIIKNSKYDKYNLRSNLDYTFNEHFTAHLNMAYAKTGTDAQNSGGGNGGGSLIGGSIAAPPALGVYNDDGSYRNLQLAYPFMSNALYNPINLNHRDFRNGGRMVRCRSEKSEGNG